MKSSEDLISDQNARDYERDLLIKDIKKEWDKMSILERHNFIANHKPLAYLLEKLIIKK